MCPCFLTTPPGFDGEEVDPLVPVISGQPVGGGGFRVPPQGFSGAGSRVFCVAVWGNMCSVVKVNTAPAWSRYRNGTKTCCGASLC